MSIEELVLHLRVVGEDLADWSLTELLDQAADEIERLREENEVLQSLANGMPVSRPAAREQ